MLERTRGFKVRISLVLFLVPRILPILRRLRRTLE